MRILLSLIIILAMVSCTDSSKTVDSTEVNGQPGIIIKRVSKEEFKVYLSENNAAQLIDVRTPEEFSLGTIKGAINIDYKSTSFEQNINKLKKNVSTLIFCKSGGRSSRALKVFANNGFNTVIELEGGYSNWND